MVAAAVHVKSVLADRAKGTHASRWEFIRQTGIKSRMPARLVSGERYLVTPDPTRSSATPLNDAPISLSPNASRLSGISELV